MDNSHLISCKNVDLLSINMTNITFDDSDIKLIMSFRLSPESDFVVTNFSIPISQAIRMYRDLNNLCHYNRTMSVASKDTPSLYKNYESCVFDKSPVSQSEKTQLNSNEI